MYRRRRIWLLLRERDGGERDREVTRTRNMRAVAGILYIFGVESKSTQHTHTQAHTDNDDSINAHKTLTLRLTNKLWTANELDSSILKCTQISIAMRHDAIYFARAYVCVWRWNSAFDSFLWYGVWFLKFAFAFKFSLNGISFRCFWFEFLLIFYSNENSGEHCKYKVMWHIFSICLAIPAFHLYLCICIPHPITLRLLVSSYAVCECFSRSLTGTFVIFVVKHCVWFCINSICFAYFQSQHIQYEWA